MMYQRGFIQIPLLIALFAGVLVLGVGGYFGIKQYENYQSRQEAEKQQTQEQLKKQQKALEQAQSEIEKLKEENEESQARQQSLEQKISAQKEEKKQDLGYLVKEWRSRIARLNCEWHLGSGNDVSKTGSGLLILDSVVVTNEHVMVIDTGTKKVNASICYVTFPDNPKVYENDRTSDVIYGGDVDIGSIFINSDQTLETIASRDVDYCENKAALGDRVAILGYPTIGSKNDGSKNEITVTDGIISGYDGYYYVTSAKIDQGNSGGVAILLEENCYLGIPAQAAVGGIESLGRILDSRIMYDASYFEKYPTGL